MSAKNRVRQLVWRITEEERTTRAVCVAALRKAGVEDVHALEILQDARIGHCECVAAVSALLKRNKHETALLAAVLDWFFGLEVGALC